MNGSATRKMAVRPFFVSKQRLCSCPVGKMGDWKVVPEENSYGIGESPREIHWFLFTFFNCALPVALCIR